MIIEYIVILENLLSRLIGLMDIPQFLRFNKRKIEVDEN